jgi:hypothetical protein
MKGLVRLCDLSSHGETLLYWAAQYHPSAAARSWRAGAHATFDPMRGGTTEEAAKLIRRGRKLPRYLRPTSASGGQRPQENKGTWTAISTPPYFTALAIWPALGRWTGGGFFDGSARIILFEPEERMTPAVTVPIPARLHIQSAARLPGGGAHMQRSARGPDNELNATDRVRYPPDARARFDALEADLKAGGLETIEWVHTAGTDVLFAADGSVFRVPGGAGLAARDYVAAARKLIDCSEMRFELMRAPPEAMRWQL